MIDITGKYEDYVTTLYTDDIDTDALKKSVLKLYQYIIDTYAHVPGRDYSGQSTMTTKLYQRYNLLLHPEEEIQNLYRFLCSAFRMTSGETGDYWIQCWLNVYKRGDYIDWHTHWPTQFKSWHGYYGLDVEGSVTTYRVPDDKRPYITVDVENKTGQVIISPSDNDEHRTWPWDKDEPRITVAFDIIPSETLIGESPWNSPTAHHSVDGTIFNNHWLPVA